MPNGRPGDNPITDLLSHDRHPFPPDIEEMLRKLAAIDPILFQELGWAPFEWEQGQNLDEGRKRLRELLNEHSGGAV